MAGILVLYSTISLLFFHPYSNAVGCNGLLDLSFADTLIVDVRGVWENLIFCGVKHSGGGGARLGKIVCNWTVIDRFCQWRD